MNTLEHELLVSKCEEETGEHNRIMDKFTARIAGKVVLEEQSLAWQSSVLCAVFDFLTRAGISPVTTVTFFAEMKGAVENGKDN